MANEHVKRCSTSHSTGKCKLKQPHTTSHLLERPQSGPPTAKRGRPVGPQERSVSADRNTTRAAALASYKTRHTLTLHSGKHTLWYLPRGLESLFPHKNLHTDGYRSFIHNCPNVGATEMSFNRWMNKQAVEHLDSGYYSMIKINELWSHKTT